MQMYTRPAGYISSGLAQLYKRHRKSQAAVASQQEVPDKHLHGIAFAESVMFLEQTHAEKEIAHVFKMADLARLYKCRLEQLDINNARDRAHSTRLKNRLLDAFPELSAQTEGRYILLTFSEDI